MKNKMTHSLFLTRNSVSERKFCEFSNTGLLADSGSRTDDAFVVDGSSPSNFFFSSVVAVADRAMANRSNRTRVETRER